MLENLYRDEALSVPVASHFGRLRGYLDAARSTLMAQRAARARTAARQCRDRPRARVRHLAVTGDDQGLDDDEVVEFMCGLVAAA